MEEFEASNGNAAETLAKEFAKEKNDIVCGFLKEKELIEMMHKEEVNNLIQKFEQDKEYMRKEFELEKEDLLQGFQTQQVEKINEFQREREKIEAKQAKDCQSLERTIEMKYKEEHLKMRRQYEEVIAEKNEEIKMLRRELLRAQHQGGDVTRASPDNDIYIKRIEHEDELRRISNDFEIEKLELERKCDREKAELVQVFANQAERMNANFDDEKQRIQQDHQKELEFKLDVTERLLSEKSDLERKRMIQQFEREITELQESLELGFKERLLEKQEAIDDLDKEKKELLNALQTERFSLAQVYNREMSLLTNPDQVTKEDVEVALIDEIAKLKQEHDDALIEMEGQHKQKIEVIKRGQQPTKELERRHSKEMEKLKKEFENEKERLETEFRNEQFNLLKSFEFERNDLEQRYEEIINEKELEIQQREDDMRRMYEGDIEELKSIVAKQREELEVSKQKLRDLAGEMEEYVSEKNRIEEKFHKENNQCQNLEQTIEKNLRIFEKNLKEAEALHEKEIAKKVEAFSREKNQLREQLENEKLHLQREIETLKARLEEFQMASENAIVSSSENILESDLVVNNVADEEGSCITAGEESKTVGTKSPLEEIERGKGPLNEREGVNEPLEKTDGEDEERAQRNRNEDVNKFLREIREKLKKCISVEEKKDTLEDLQMSNKQMKDELNQVIVEIDNLCGSKGKCEVSLEDEATFSLEDQLLTLEDILKEGDADGKSEKSRKDQMNEKVKDILKNAHRCHEVEKLKLKEEHQEEIKNVMKEVADEKRARVQDSLEALKLLQELDKNGGQSLNFVALKSTEERGTLTDDLDNNNKKDDSSPTRTRKEVKESDAHVPSDIVEELRHEKEEMKRSIDELEKSFTKEKEELVEKLQTQHKEFVMSTEGEIIENLLKQKSTLEEAFNLERFYLSRLYYLEMKDELEDVLCRKKEKMKRDFDREKMDIVLKYESEIADLHSLLSEKGEMELRLLQERNDTMRKLLASQKRKSPEKGKGEDKRNENERLEREKENLEVTIPLKKEIAELQNKRHQEHETAVANLKDAIDLIKDIISSPPSISQEDDQQLDRYSFISEDPVRSAVNSPEEKSSENNLKSGRRLLLSEDEIRSKDELKAALENLVDLVVNDDEDSVYESHTTSGASSDLESEESGPTTVNGESDEGAFSGPESTDGDTLKIKKAELDFVFNLERFNLGRVYYGEYRDSLKKAMKKLAKAKDSLRNKRKDLENDLLSGIKKLVDRTQFGNENKQVHTPDIITSGVEEAVITDNEDRTKDDIDGTQLTATKKEDNKAASESGDDGAYIESDQEEEKKKEYFQDTFPNKQDHPRSEKDIESATDVDKIETDTEPEIERELTQEKEEHPGWMVKKSGLLEDKADDGRATEKRENISPSLEVTESKGLQDNTEKEHDSEAEMKLKDVSFKKPLHKDDQVTTGDRGEFSRGKKDAEEDADAEPHTNEDNFTEEAKLPNQNNERLMEDIGEASLGNKDDTEHHTKEDILPEPGHRSTEDKGVASQGIKDADKDDGEEQAARDSIVTKDEGVTEIEAGEGKDGLDGDMSDHEAKQEKEQPVIHKEDQAHKPLDEDKWVATDREGEIKEAGKTDQKNETTEDHHESEVQPKGDSKEVDADELKVKLKPSDETPKEDKPQLEGNEKHDNFEDIVDENLSESEEKDNVPRLSDNTDVLSQATDEANEEVSRQRSPSPVNDQDLIKQLNRNNKVLQDKFNLLCELVGKAFVKEIPELNDEKDKDGGNLVALENLNDLYTEKERLKDELKQVDSKIKEITATGNDKLRDLNKRLDDEEMQLLHSLREIDKHLKTNDDKELLEHLLKEKEEVCTKLDEINSLLNEQKEAMIELRTKDTHTVPGLMCKKDVLNDDLCEKERQLSHKTKMLEAATKAAGKEKENLRNSLNSLNAQLAALEDGMLESDINAYPHGASQSNEELPPEIASLVKSETDTENDRARLEKEIKKTENDIGRYFRILEEQRNRLQPFQRKRTRIKESLDWANSIADTKGKTISRQNEGDDVEEPVKNETEALLADETKRLDKAEAAGAKQREIGKKIEELDLTISNLELPYELEQEFTEEIPKADKMGIANRVKLRTEEDLKCLEEKIVEEQAQLNEAGFSDPITLTQHLVEKEYLTKENAKFDKYPSTVDGTMGEENLPLVKQLKNLLSRKESLEEKAQKLEGEISDEQHNFIDARQFKSAGNVNAESESTIKKLIDTKAKSVAGLQDTNEKILQSLSVGGLKGPQSELIEECVERKVKLEDEIDKLQDKIDDETVRAAEMLADLLEQKSAIREELQNTSESATEEAKKLQENVSCYDNIPEEIDELISQALQEPENTAAVTQDRKELHQRQREMEAIVKEKAESLREAKRQEQDPEEVEDALEQVIRNKIPVDKRLQEMYEDENGSKRSTFQLPSTRRKHKERPAEASKLEDDQGKDDDTIYQVIDEKTSLDKSIQKGIEDRNYGSEAALPLSKTRVKDEVDAGSKHSDDNLEEKRRELQESLHETENRLCSMLQVSRSSEPSDGIEKDHLEKLKSLAAEKVKLEKCLRQTELLEDLLNKKETLLQQQLCSKDAGEERFQRKTQQESELKKLNTLIERRENEMEKMEMKKDDKEKVRDQLNREKEKLDEILEHLKENIEKAKKDVEAALDEVTTNINEHEKCSSEEVEALQQELQFLQNEIELCNNEVNEIDKELTRLKKESRQRKDAIPGDVLDLEKLIIEKENLREYLAEIDATLDNSQADASEQATPAKIEELRKQKNEVEIKLEEIRNEKAKLDVEFEDDEMDEEVKELAQRKNELEERKREVSDQIRGSGVVGKLAGKRKKHESKMPRYYIQGILDDMARDEKTLTELIKEQEDLKEASQRKSESLEDVIDLLKSKIGEDLVNIITSLGSDDIQSNREKEYQPGIDEVQGNEATISDILSDLSAENKELRDMNGELSSNLEKLQEKIGEEIVGALLNQNLPNNDLEFGDVISALQDEKETMSSILHKHKEEKDFIEDTLGKDLLNSILRTEDPLDKRHQADSALGLAAPAIMRKYDEDLENVIAVYEKELGKLSHENDLLKEKLGKDLSRALLQMSKGMETPVDIDKTEQEKTQDGKTCLDEIQFEEEPPSVDVRQDIRSPSIFEGCTSYSQEGSDSDYMLTGRTDTGSESMEMKESMDSFDVHKPETTEINEFEKQQDIRSSKEQQLPGDLDNFNDMDTLPEQGNMSTIRKNSIEPRLCNIFASYFGSPVEKSSCDITEEDDEIVEVSLNAPTIMRDNGNTLEEVIAQYENDLGRTAGKTAKRRAASGGLSPRRADRPENSDGISELDETMQGIVDAQEKNMEILRVLRERLGEDLVYALINETEEDHLDDLMNNVKQRKTTDFVDSQGDDEVIFQEKSLSAQENEQADEQTSTEVKETLHSSVDVLPREKPAISLDNESDAVQRNLCDEDTANKRTLKAPSIALEKNKTLADVIESYEVGLDSLRSKLGPSLTNTLLSMEDQTIQGREEIEQGMRMTPTRELKGEAPSKERDETTDDEGNERETDSDVTNTPEEIPGELVSAEKECYPVKELRAPDIMATSGKTLEEVIEDYEERINEELNNLEKEVGLLKEKLGNDLFHTLLAHSNTDVERPPAEEITDQEQFKESDPESFAMVQDAPLADDLKAKALLQDEGKTVEIILRKYERQLEELAKLVPKENNEGVSILDLTSNYEDTIADLEKENKTFADRLANLSEIIGPDLLQRLENIEEEHSSKTEDGVGSVGEDGIKAPLVMQKENKSLENVLRNYEKELDVLRKMLPNQSGEDISIADIVKDYEDRIEDVENRNTSLKGEHDRLLNRIGSDLVGDILTLTLVEDGSNGGSIHHSEGDSLTKTETSQFDNASRLNAPDIMKRDDSTLEEVLGIYEKALGLLPRTRVFRDDSFVDSKMHTFDDLKRENKILKDALGDSLAADLVAAAEKATSPTSDASKKSTKTGELNGQSEERAKIVTDPAENVKQSSEQDREDYVPVYTEENKMEAVELVRDQGRTIENILKDYEKELEALRKLVPSETSQGASVSELVKDYEDKIEKLENEKETLLDMLDNLEKNVGPDLMNELQNLNAGNNEYLGGKKPCGLQAPSLMQNESRTLEGVVKRYENELDVLRKLIPDEGSEASSISDIIKDYEDRVADLSIDNKTLKDELRELEEKVGDGLVNDLKNVAVTKFEETESASEAGEDGNNRNIKTKRTLKAPGMMNEVQSPLEDIVGTYEQDLYNLARENKIYKDGLGKGLAEALLQMEQDRDNLSSKKFETQDLQASSKSKETKEMLLDKPAELSQDTIVAIRGTYSEYVNQPPQNEVDDEAIAISGTGPNQLKATTLLRDDGKDLEKILKNYEKELDALRQLSPGETEGGISISDLINNYENKIDTLEGENKLLTQKLDDLRETIGQSLYGELENVKREEIADDDKGYSIDNEINIDAINVMKNEDRNLENVVKNYEKELIALRKLVPDGEGESGSISDVIKDYEDKVEELQRQNEDLRNTLDELEGKIGSNLFKDLTEVYTEGDEVGGASDDVGFQEKVEDLELQVKSGAPEVMVERKLTLESILASQEKDINDLTNENKVLKDTLGPRFAETVLDMADQKAMALLPDSDDRNHETNMQVNDKPTTSALARKEKGSKNQRINKDSMEDLTKVYAQPLDTNNNDEKEVSTASPVGNLKAESLIRDEGRTIENILKNYEKELEALTKLVPTDDGISFSDLVTKYEDTIEGLVNENDGLVRRLDNIQKKIGAKLLRAVENGESEAEPREKHDSDHGSECILMAPRIMQTEERTLENVVNTYEKELDALRSLIPSEGQEGQSINDVVKAYEDKLDQLRAENDSLRKDSDGLVKRIGPNLVDDIKKLEEISSDVTEGTNQSDVEPDSGTEKPVKDLKVTQIMDVKQSTLEDVLETYENALGIFLSDSSSSMDELSSHNFIDDHASTIEELKQENDILKNSVGVSLSQRLLNIASDNEGASEKNSHHNHETAQSSDGEMDPVVDEKDVTKFSKHPPEKGSQKDTMSKSMSSPGELKAESLIKEEGRTIENILKNYEKELEALKSLDSNDSGQPVDAISNLVTKYEDEVENLEKEKSNLTDRIAFLEGKIGPDLMSDLETQKQLHTKDTEETLGGNRKSELNAPVIMEEENRTLETVINCYEKELDALRKLAPNQKEGQQVSISDIIKDYEDELNDLKEENNSLKHHYDTLANKLGSNLVNDIRRLKEEEIEGGALFEDENKTKGQMKAAGSEKPLKASQIMRENNSTLANVLETYEDALGLNLDSPGLSNEDTENVSATDDQLQAFKELQGENKTFKKTLGEKLAQNILKMAKEAEIEGDFEYDDSKEGKDGTNTLTELAHERRSSLAIERKDRKPFEVDTTSPSDELKANALLRDKGKTVENILRNYEKEIEALSKLIPNEEEMGYSISDLVKEYEERIEGLKTENCSFENRLECLTEKIGQDLVSDLESPVLVEERDNDDLEAPLVMQKEGKTLENILRNYEKELEALRKTVLDQGENPYAITDMVHDYEGRIEDLKAENEKFKEKFGSLKQRIGSDLLEHVLLIESDVAKDDFEEEREREICNKQSKLEAPKIMQEKNVTLEDVLETYETALSSGSSDEMMSKVHNILDDKTTHNLERENKVFRGALGDSLTQKLLEANKIKGVAGSQQKDDDKTSTPGLSTGTGTINITEKSEQLPKKALAGDLRATALIIDEGKTIENVLRKYERDLEALSRLHHKDVDTPTSDITDYGDDSLKSNSENGTEDVADERVGSPMASASGKPRRHSDEEIDLLKEKVGSDLVNELLLRSETDPGRKQRWEALKKIEEEEKTLADILETYERDLKRLKREKSAIEVLVNDNESDGQSALDIISQYEDEIEHLKDKNKELETKLSVLIARMGDNLVNDVLLINNNLEKTSRFSLKALEIMEKQEKQLSAILEQYESDISKLTRENEMLNAIASKESVDGKPLTSLLSEYEGKIQELLVDKHETEANLRVLSEKVGGSLANDILRPGEETLSPLDALKIMENEGKTLPEVTEEYENDLARMKREIGALQSLVSEDFEKSSFMERISKYEDEISNLNNKIQAQTRLEKKVGVDLSRQLTALDENVSKFKRENITFKAVQVMEKDKDITLADIIRDYEEELEKKEHEILTLKELVSGDILEIATSQESEIDELKKVKAILANELDLISAKVGKELTDEIMKRSNQQPKKEIKMLYPEIVERMETEGKSLANILEDLENETKLMRSRNEELSNKEDTLTKVSEKIGRDLLEELLTGDLSEGSRTEVKPLFQASELMSLEEKTLGEVVVNYENELEKLKRENGALRLLTEKGNSQDKSVLNVLSDYEEKIEKLKGENGEFNKRLQKLTQRVGTELTEELLKLPDYVDNSPAELVNQLQALKTLEENQTTLAHVLQKYENRLKKGEEADVGPFVSGQPITEDVRYAQLIHASEIEPQISISEDEPLEKTRYLQEDETDETENLRESALYRPVDSKQISPDDHEQIKKQNKIVEEEIIRVEIPMHEEHFNSEYMEKLFGSEMPVVETGDQCEETDSTWAKTSAHDKYELQSLKKKVNELEKELEEEKKLREKYGKDLQDLLQNVDYNNLVQDEEITASSPNAGVNETDESIVPFDLDLRALENLVLKEQEIMSHPEESRLFCQDHKIIEEEIIRVEIPMHEEHFNSEYMDKLFGSEMPVIETGDQCEVTDSTWAETYLNQDASERSSPHDGYQLRSLNNKVNELEKELEEEKKLREKYEKDVQDLLQDIVDLKMKQAGDDDEETPEETRQRIKEEVELKQDNKRIQEDLRKERKRRLSIEESKRDLLDEVDSLMREKEMLLKQQNGAKDSDKLLEDMINLRKKLGELDTENKHLNKEVNELKEALSEVMVTHDDEKNKLLENCQKEKSDMMEELVASKVELETQLQELLGMNDDLKGTIKNLQEELKESSEKLSTGGEVENENECTDADLNNNGEDTDSLLRKLKQLELEAKENEKDLLYEKEKNEKLKEQLDETENALKQTLTKYQDEIKSIETEKAKQEDELRKEIEILNKLQIEEASAEQKQKDFEKVVQREKKRLKEDIETEHEREKKKLQHDFEDKEEELSRQGKRRSAQLQDQEEQWKKEREELQAIFRAEKEKLQKAFDEELNRKINENDEQHKQRNEEMNRKFAKEKKEIKATIEKKIYEQLLDKNIAAESDFQEVLSKILQEHAKEIEGVENDIRKAEERFKEDKNKLVEQSDSEKEALKRVHEEEKKALESTVQNLLKEVVKLKQQRKEIRMIHKKEKETMEEIYERDRIKLKDDWEQYKRDLLSKLHEDFDNKLANETTKLQTRLEDIKQELEKSEQRRKELEERLKGNAIDSEHVRPYEEAEGDKTEKDDEAHSRELKSVKKSLEEEYDKRLKEEKRKFEETLQGLRREIGNLQEKRKLIQDKIYNQDPSLVDRNVMEKSIANYKMEMLSKMEEEVAQKIAREKKPLEENIKEQQLEIDDLKRQRWELRNQIRRERSKLEEEFELERERMENQFLKEKEELKSKIETRLQREMTKRAMEDKVSRAPSPIPIELPYSPQSSPRRLRSENMSLRDDNQRLEIEVRQLTSKLEALESSFEGIMSSEKIKFERMKRIQAKMPKKVTFSDEVETRMMDYNTGDPNETVLQELRERDNQVRQLLEQKRFYEEVLSELCEEAGLFELDQNVVI